MRCTASGLAQRPIAKQKPVYCLQKSQLPVCSNVKLSGNSKDEDSLLCPQCEQRWGWGLLPRASGLGLGDSLVPLSISLVGQLALLDKRTCEDPDLRAVSSHIGGGKNTASM